MAPKPIPLLPSRRSITRTVPRKLQPTPRRKAVESSLETRGPSRGDPIYPSLPPKRPAPLPPGLRRLRLSAPSTTTASSAPAPPPVSPCSVPPPSLAALPSSSLSIAPHPPPPPLASIPSISKPLAQDTVSLVSPYAQPVGKVAEGRRRSKSPTTFETGMSAKYKKDLREGVMKTVSYEYVGSSREDYLDAQEPTPGIPFDAEEQELFRQAALRGDRPPNLDEKVLPFKPETRPHLTLRNLPSTALPADVDVLLRGLLGETEELPDYRFIRSPFIPSDDPHIVRVYPRTLAEFDHIYNSLPRPPPHVPSPFRNTPPPDICSSRKVGASVVWATNTALERPPLLLDARMEAKEGWDEWSDQKGEREDLRCVSERGHHVVLTLWNISRQEIEEAGLDSLKKDVRLWLRTRGIVRQIMDEDIGFPQFFNFRGTSCIHIAVTLSLISLSPSYPRTRELYQRWNAKRAREAATSVIDRTFADIPNTWVHFSELASVDELHQFFPTVNPMSFARNLADTYPSPPTSPAFFSPNTDHSSVSTPSVIAKEHPIVETDYRSPEPPQTLDAWWTPAVQRLKCFSLPHNISSPRFLWLNLPEHLFFTFLRPISLSPLTQPPPRLHLRNLLSRSFLDMGRGYLPLFRSIAAMQARLSPSVSQAQSDAEDDREKAERARKRPTRVVVEGLPDGTTGGGFETWLKKADVGGWVDCLFQADHWSTREREASAGGRPREWAGKDLQVGGFVQMDGDGRSSGSAFAVVVPTSRDAARVVSSLDNAFYRPEQYCNQYPLKAWIQHV